MAFIGLNSCHWHKSTSRLSLPFAKPAVTFPAPEAPYGLRGCNAPWFMCWFWRYINCLFVYLTSFLTSFLPYAFVLAYLLLYSFTSWLIYLLLPEQARSVSRPEVVGDEQTLIWFLYVVVYLVTGACLLSLCLFSFFSTKPRDWLEGKNVSEMT